MGDVKLARATGPKARQTRAAILDAAEAVFAERGYGVARLEDIAARVGIRRASLVYYFKNKGALYEAVLDGLLGDLLARYQRVLATNGSHADRMEREVEEWVAFVQERPALLRITLRELADGLTPHSRPFAERLAPVFAAIGDLIRAGQASGAFRPIDPLDCMMMIAGATAFLILRDPMIAVPGMETAADDCERQRQVLLSLIRAVLGTRGPRAVRDRDA